MRIVISYNIWHKCVVNVKLYQNENSFKDIQHNFVISKIELFSWKFNKQNTKQFLKYLSAFSRNKFITNFFFRPYLIRPYSDHIFDHIGISSLAELYDAHEDLEYQFFISKNFYISMYSLKNYHTWAIIISFQPETFQRKYFVYHWIPQYVLWVI